MAKNGLPKINCISSSSSTSKTIKSVEKINLSTFTNKCLQQGLLDALCTNLPIATRLVGFASSSLSFLKTKINRKRHQINTFSKFTHYLIKMRVAYCVWNCETPQIVQLEWQLLLQYIIALLSYHNNFMFLKLTLVLQDVLQKLSILAIWSNASIKNMLICNCLKMLRNLINWFSILSFFQYFKKGNWEIIN